jgi:hypothetical protein
MPHSSRSISATRAATAGDLGFVAATGFGFAAVAGFGFAAIFAAGGEGAGGSAADEACFVKKLVMLLRALMSLREVGSVAR